MSNGQLTQFERNNYFYGKLLTVRDFQLEQSYMNEKRSLLNRMVHGTGVAFGLRLVPLDASGFRLTPGTALDPYGREIVVNANLDIADATKLAGYPPVYAGGVLYAKLVYDETAREPVPAMSNTSGITGTEANKIRETYRLLLTEQAPPRPRGLNEYYRETKTVFESEQLIVHRTVPRYVNPGDIAEVELAVTAKAQLPAAYQLDVAEELSSHLSAVSYFKDGKIPFVLSGLAAQTKRTQRYYVRVESEDAGSATIVGKVYVNGSAQSMQGSSVLSIVKDRPVIRLLAEQYTAENGAGGAPDEEGVVLAALTFSGSGTITHIDESARPLVYNNELLYQLVLNERQSLQSLPAHAAEHRQGGSDELQVEGLAGILADPQKVAVFEDGKALSPRTQLNFTGTGVTASEDAANKNRITVHIPGQSAHAATHQDGGADELNVAGLSGLLADPQRIVVQDEGKSLPARTQLNFTGAGVTATDDSANSRINIAISGQSAHAATHANGGADELNVTGLSGLLADPQRVTVQGGGISLPARPTINFVGTNVTASDDSANNRINVAISGGSGAARDVASGIVMFPEMYPGETRESQEIYHQLPYEHICISLSVVNRVIYDGGIESIRGAEAGSAIGSALTPGIPDDSSGADLSQGPVISNPVPLPDPGPGPIVIPLPTSDTIVKFGDVAMMEPLAPLLVATCSEESRSFKILLYDRRPRDGAIYSNDWIVRWWAFGSTIEIPEVVVPPYKPDESIAQASLRSAGQDAAAEQAEKENDQPRAKIAARKVSSKKAFDPPAEDGSDTK